MMATAATGSRPAGRLAAAWRAAGLLYLGLCVAGLALGLWPQIIYPTIREGPGPAPLPALRTVAIAQAAFFAMAYPLVMLVRSAKNRAGGLAASLLECGTMVVLSLPMVATAAWLADAALADMVRAQLYVLAIAALGCGLGQLARRPAAATAVAVAGAAVLLGLPAAAYIVLEFSPLETTRLWDASPALAAWGVAASRQMAVLPQPLWAWLLWPAVGAAAALLAVLLRKRTAIGE
jgi:hypothetical protein